MRMTKYEFFEGIGYALVLAALICTFAAGIGFVSKFLSFEEVAMMLIYSGAMMLGGANLAQVMKIRTQMAELRKKNARLYAKVHKKPNDFERDWKPYFLGFED